MGRNQNLLWKVIGLLALGSLVADAHNYPVRSKWNFIMKVTSPLQLAGSIHFSPPLFGYYSSLAAAFTTVRVWPLICDCGRGLRSKSFRPSLPQDGLAARVLLPHSADDNEFGFCAMTFRPAPCDFVMLIVVCVFVPVLIVRLLSLPTQLHRRRNPLCR